MELTELIEMLQKIQNAQEPATEPAEPQQEPGAEPMGEPTAEPQQELPAEPPADSATLTDEIVKKLSEMFANQPAATSDPIEDYLNSDDSMTGRALRSYGLEPEKL